MTKLNCSHVHTFNTEDGVFNLICVKCGETHSVDYMADAAEDSDAK